MFVMPLSITCFIDRCIAISGKYLSHCVRHQLYHLCVVSTAPCDSSIIERHWY